MAQEIVFLTYSITKKFPSEEKYTLVQQMNRAAVSISSNIAEGTSRNSEKDVVRFVNMSYGSLMELVCQMEIAQKLSYINNDDFDDFNAKASNLAVKINNYSKAVRKRIE